MKTANFNLLRYPIGPFVKPEYVSTDMRSSAISDIGAFAGKMRSELETLKESEWELRYRPGGWTIRQVVHHCADSHMMGYARFKLAMTRKAPAVPGYEEFLWAELDDTIKVSPTISLNILEHVHKRWSVLLHSLSDDDWKRTYRKDTGEVFSLEESAVLYAWHGNHHLAHIQIARKNYI